MVHSIAKISIVPLIRGLFIKKVNGIENIPKGEGFIAAANHCSYLDHYLISCILVPHLNKKVHYLAKKEHFDSLHQRLWHKWVGAIPIDRQKGGKEALRMAVAYLRKGKVIGIYPEGTRSLDGKLQRGKTGVARLALAAKVPVIPIGIIGSFKILPKGRYMPSAGKAVINIGKPMLFEAYYGKENNHKVLRVVTKSIMKEIAKLSHQAYRFD